jgi:hypothetical protein
MSTVDHLAPYCPMPSPSTDVDVTRREGSTLILQSRIKLNEASGTICSYLPHWAREAPDRMFLAQRTGDNAWQQISYGEFWSRVPCQLRLLAGQEHGRTMSSGATVDVMTVRRLRLNATTWPKLKECP